MTAFARQAFNAFTDASANANGGYIVKHTPDAHPDLQWGAGGDLFQIKTIRDNYDPGPKREAALVPLVTRRQAAHDQLVSKLNTIVAEAKAHEVTMRPQNIERRLVMASTAKMAVVASVRAMAAGARPAELKAMAEDAVKRRDDATAYALRIEIASRPSEQAEAVMPLLKMLDTIHSEEHFETVANIIGAQHVRMQAVLGGPLFEHPMRPGGPRPERMMNEANEASSYLNERGELVALPEDTVRAMLWKLGITDKEPVFNTAPPGLGAPKAAA